jgi:uncharacterized protein
MTDEERAIMMKHVAYWTEIMNRGKVLAFGPVLDPNEIYGLGIISVDSEQEVKDFIDRYEYFPMKAIVPAR